MAHPFLAPEWFTAVHEIRQRFADRAAPIPAAVRMNVQVSGTPFSADGVAMHLDTSSGALEVAEGLLDDPDLTISTDWGTARALFVDQDQAAVMQAFLGGQLKIQGDMMKLMALQATMPIDDTAIEVTREIQAITE